MQGLPEVIDETFDGLELGLICHLLTLLDVVTQIEIGPLKLLDLRYLPENAVGAITGFVYGSVVKSVDGRDARFDDVNDANHAQATGFFTLRAIPKFD
jgi:hypothetical protein